MAGVLGGHLNRLKARHRPCVFAADRFPCIIFEGRRGAAGDMASGAVMLDRQLPTTFIANAADVLGHTKDGLSGSDIAKLMRGYGGEYGVEVPYPPHTTLREVTCPAKIPVEVTCPESSRESMGFREPKTCDQIGSKSGCSH